MKEISCSPHHRTIDGRQHPRVTTTGDRAGSGASIRYLWRRSRPLRLAAALAVAGAGIDLARPWPLLLVVDSAVDRRPPGQPWATLLAPVGYSPFGVALAAGLAVMSLALAGALLSFLGSYLAGASAEQIGGDLRADLHTRLLSLSPGFHDHHRAGELAARLTNDVSRVQEALAATVTNVLPHSVTLIGTALVLLAINPPMALAGLAVATAGAVVVTDMRKRLVVAQVEQRDRVADVLARAVEVLRNVRLVQALAYRPGVERSFRARNLDVVRSGLRAAELNAGHEPTAGIIVAAGATLVLWIGAYAVLTGGMTVGILVVVLWYVMALYVPVRSLTWLTSVLGRGVASWERVAEILRGDETASETDEAPILPNPREAIVFRGVCFRYFPTQPVLNELDLRIPAGGTLCIVGPTGAGKSTLLSLLVRFYDPQEGAIEVDGVDLRSFDLPSVRERIALIPQDPALLDGSLLENIAIGRPNASQTDVMEAARMALVHDFAQALPEGYHSRVGEGGAPLSAGQRRCVALARALVRQAPILLLDDPTAGLDADSETRLLAAIRHAPGPRTVVMVTQRLTTAFESDRVVAIRDGRIVEARPPAPPALPPAVATQPGER